MQAGLTWRVGAVAGMVWLACGPPPSYARKHKTKQESQVVVAAGRAGCAVDLDSTPVGATNDRGELLLGSVQPGDHYLHLHCPQEAEITFFVSPQAGETVHLSPDQPGEVGGAHASSALAAAESQMELHSLVSKAIDQRGDGHLDQAVQELRDAAALDPDNADLHRELGITFLMEKDWEPARVEMLEALHHNPNDADAHGNLGYALEKLGNYQAALDEFRTATHLDPHDASYREHYLEALALLAAQQDQAKGKKKRKQTD